MNAAFRCMLNNNNFVHTPLHAVRVYDQALLLCEAENMALDEMQKIAL
jgi:hypothetical protein